MRTQRNGQAEVTCGNEEDSRSQACRLASFLALFPGSFGGTACFAMSPISPELKVDDFYPPLNGDVRQMALMVVNLSNQGHARNSAARLEAAVHSLS